MQRKALACTAGLDVVKRMMPYADRLTASDWDPLAVGITVLLVGLFALVLSL